MSRTACGRFALRWVACDCAPGVSRLWLRLLIVATAVSLPLTSRAVDVETVRISPDQGAFILHPTGKAFIPWGHNYASVDVLQRLAKDPDRVKQDFAEMRAAGTTVARVHPELPRLLAGPNEASPQAIANLKLLLEIAENTGIRLKITGLGCYQIKDRAAWYDALPETKRWQTQAFYWETVARAAAESPALFAYDLVNEPAAIGKPSDGWYMGRMGEVEFCQRLSLDPGDRDADQIFREWIASMVAAIRKHDRSGLVTMGMLPFPGAYKAASEQLDFVSPHLYPKSGKVTEELAVLKQFAWGKPIVIGETFPLSCSAEDEREFLLNSRDSAKGWLGHWPDQPPSELAEKKRAGNATIADEVWLSWVKLFEELGPLMISARK